MRSPIRAAPATPPAGPDSTSAIGRARAAAARARAGARLHHEQRSAQAGGGQPRLQLAEVAVDRGLHVGVEHGGARALVLAPLARDLGRGGHGDAGQPLAQRCAERLLVLGMGVGVQQADRDGLDPVALAGGSDRLGVRSGRAGRGRRRGGRRARAPRSGGAAATNGGGLRETRLYMSGRLPRPISSTSRKPLVVTSAVRAPVRSVSALITTVVPCTSSSISAGSTSPAAITSSTPCARSRGVVETFAIRTSPLSESTTTRSVNVPPMSVATRSVIAPAAWPSPPRPARATRDRARRRSRSRASSTVT